MPCVQTPCSGTEAVNAYGATTWGNYVEKAGTTGGTYDTYTFLRKAFQKYEL